MSKCNVCGKPRSLFLMNNRAVCIKCDELLFDLEIECEEEIQQLPEKRSEKQPGLRKVLPSLKK